MSRAPNPKTYYRHMYLSKAAPAAPQQVVHSATFPHAGGANQFGWSEFGGLR